MTQCCIPSDEFASGVDVDERSFTWRISNFPVILKQTSLIKSQRINFTAGEKVDLGSKWLAYLQQAHDKIDEVEGAYIGIFFQLKKNSILPSKQLYVQFSATIHDRDGEKSWWRGESEIKDWNKLDVGLCGSQSLGWRKLINMSESEVANIPLVEESCLVIHIRFKIFAPSKPTEELLPVQLTLEGLQAMAMAKACKELAGSLKDHADCNSVKILKSNDGKEFLVQNRVLSARSPVFRAMLNADMTEANGGAIQLPDISSKALHTLLNFICTGELLPEWAESETLVELTNAAAKYQLPDLLHFLDLVLGKVCHLDNVGPLMIMAHKLSLKTAETELLNFMKTIGTSTPEYMVQVLTGVLTPDCFPGPDYKRKKSSRSIRSLLLSCFGKSSK